MKNRLKLIAFATAGALMIAGCGGNSSTGSSTATPSASAPSTQSAAADLRTKLNLLLGEHLILAAKATGAAVGGRNDEFAAYGTLLNTNGTDIGEQIGAAFGDDAKNQFNSIWSAHNGFFVDYTKAAATKNDAGKTKAVNDLMNTYVPAFSKLLSGATGLPETAVTELTKHHVLTTAAIVDDEVAKDYAKEYADINMAYKHMQAIGDPVSEAIVKKVPAKFTGAAATKSVDIRVALNLLLQQHLYLASMATGAALGGRNDEFAAAGAALNTNGTDIGTAIGSLYGQAAADKFNSIWSAHNGFFVDYTKGVAANDPAKKMKAVDDLTHTYVPAFSDFISGATGLPKEAVATLTAMHVTTTATIVDDQGAKKTAQAATDDRAAAQHMQMIADPLAQGIVTKLPDKFRG